MLRVGISICVFVCAAALAGIAVCSVEINAESNALKRSVLAACVCNDAGSSVKVVLPDPFQVQGSSVWNTEDPALCGSSNSLTLCWFNPCVPDRVTEDGKLLSCNGWNQPALSTVPIKNIGPVVIIVVVVLIATVLFSFGLTVDLVSTRRRGYVAV